MRKMAIGVLVGAGLMVLATWVFRSPQAAYAHHGASHTAGSDLIALSTQRPDGREQLTVIDPKARVISVYHIDPASGELALRSVRNIQWDLQMSQFNSAGPLPQEIRSLLNQN